ncbi:MAG: TonB-dependent receptor [Sphingobium sp.]|uniref:TonB-dependent receptor n=1 Tax=Sphingobium sp. TaxID=1912891 RepID=UPI0029B9CE6A|nr:TonB-dependent receptor [Sphingobium sp.]MDX3911701.1 TonB-dependent receptor [Sphingobium sp.]
MRLSVVNLRRVPGLLCTAATCLWSPSIHAQVAETREAVDQAASTVTEGSGGGDIVVTATRRSESLRNVPIAVTALTGEAVKDMRITNFSDIPAIMPGAAFISTKGPSTASIVIRAQSTTNDSPHLDIPVAIFQDDIYFGTLASFASDFFDLEQLAVLRGPQGTTFGRNVVGGAIQITSKKARVGDTSGEINVTLSHYSPARDPGIDSQGYFNLATSDTSAFRLAYSSKLIGGYSPNRTTGGYLTNQRSIALRPTFTWEANDAITIGLMGQYFHENGNSAAYRMVGEGAENARCDAIRKTNWDVCHNLDGTNARTIWLTQARVDADLGPAKLTSITSFRHLKTNYVDDGDSSSNLTNVESINDSKEEEYSQELRIASQGDDRFQYVGGVYLSYERLQKTIHLGFDGTVPNMRLATLTGGQLQRQIVDGISKVSSGAVFLEGKYRFTPTLALTLGGRYTIEHKEAATIHDGFTVFYGSPYSVTDLRETWNAFTPRTILEFKPHDGLLFYGSVSRGFKGGGWSLTGRTPAAARIALQPEKSTSYELGAKLRLLDSLDLNIAAYHADTTNLQVRNLVNGALTDTNAGKLRVKGVEVESVFRLSPQFNMTANYAYTDAYFVSFSGCASGIDCTGNNAPYAPKHDITVGGHYNTDIGAGHLTADLTSQWASNFAVGALNNQSFAESHTAKKGIVNASIGYRFPDRRTRILMWGRNLTNTWSFSAASDFSFLLLTQAEYAAGAREVDRGSISPPRQIGMTLTRSF